MSSFNSLGHCVVSQTPAESSVCVSGCLCVTFAKETLLFSRQQISADGGEVSSGDFHVVVVLRAALGREPGRDKHGGSATPVETVLERVLSNCERKKLFIDVICLLI